MLKEECRLFQKVWLGWTCLLYTSFEKAVTIGGLKKEKTSVDDSITKRLKDMLFEAKQK